MVRRTVAIAILSLSVGACASPAPAGNPSATTQPVSQPAAPPSPPPPSIDFGPGFFPAERAADGSSWRWMGDEGVVFLRNTRRDMKLTIKGRAPLEFAEPPTLNVELDGSPLPAIPKARGEVSATYEVSADQLGVVEWNRLRLTTKTVVPHDVNPQSPDKRRVGFALYDLSWQSK